jgi:hypothetical protein
MIDGGPLVGWLLLGSAVIAGYLGGFLRAYLSKKGENQATKEDIAELTRKVEEVRHEFVVRVEEIRHGFAIQAEEHSQKNRLKLAALERRLEVHQEAYTLWRHLYFTVHRENVGAVVQECQTWWEKNCVYLGPEVRDAFLEGFQAAHGHREILLSDRKYAKENWAKVERVGRLILEATGLPGFGSVEKKELDERAEPAKGSGDQEG